MIGTGFALIKLKQIKRSEGNDEVNEIKRVFTD
jgi:hypothetical protein